MEGLDEPANDITQVCKAAWSWKSKCMAVQI